MILQARKNKMKSKDMLAKKKKMWWDMLSAVLPT